MIRSLVPMLREDRYMSDDIELIAAALGDGQFLAAASASNVELR